MTIDLSRIRIFVRPGVTDMRKQINGLSSIVEEAMFLDPLDGSLFLFMGRDRRKIKALYWDRNGFCLWQKRLERDRFPWPRDSSDPLDYLREINRTELEQLLSGIDFWNAHRPIIFSRSG